MKTKIFFSVFLICFLAVSIFTPINPVFGATSDFTAYQSIVIGSASGAGTNYQVRLDVYWEEGTSSGNNIYINENNESTFPHDINFSDNDQSTWLDYWLEEYNNTWASFWVEVADNVTSNPATIYCYYGKSGETTKSSGVNTFIEFEDGNDITDWTEDPVFTGGDLDNSTTLFYTGTHSVKSTSGVSTGMWYRSISTLNDNGKAWQYRINIDSLNTNKDTREYYLNGTPYSGGTRGAILEWDEDVGDQNLHYYDGSMQTIGPFYEDTWYLVELSDWNFSADTHDINFTGSSGGGNVDDASFEVDMSSFTHVYLVTLANSGTIVYYDNMLARKWVDPEPTVTAQDDETENPDLAPIWQNSGANASNINVGDPILLYAQGRDNGGGLDQAWLNTNETGAEHNYTEATVYGTSWVKDGVNPIWQNSSYAWSTGTCDGSPILRYPTNGTPIMYDSKYWMIYAVRNFSNSDMGIGLAYSTNLVNWTDSNDSPILNYNDTDAEAWENETLGTWGLITSDFLYMGDETGHSFDFWIYYVGHNGTGFESIGVAKSNNMTTWERDLAHNPITSWSDVEDFRVQKMSNGSWCAVYEDDTNYPSANALLFTAISSSTLPHDGWSNISRIFSIVDSGRTTTANPALIRYDEAGSTYYEMLYESLHGGENHAYGAWCTEANFWTEDAWTRSKYNPIIEDDEAWDGVSVIPNGLIEYNGELICYYQGGGTATSAVGMANGSHVSRMGSFDPVYYGSPMDLGGVADSWVWSNFTWVNASIGLGTVIQWKIYYNDTFGNINVTNGLTFTVGYLSFDYAFTGQVNITGSFTKTVALLRMVSETVLINDDSSATRELGEVSSVGTVLIMDGSTSLRELSELESETVLINDGSTVRPEYLRGGTETLYINDALTRSRGLLHLAIETILINDVLTASGEFLVADVTVLGSGTIIISDSLSALRELLHTGTETLLIVDALTRLRELIESTSETVIINDVFTRLVEAGVFVYESTETVIISPTVSLTTELVTTLLDVLGFATIGFILALCAIAISVVAFSKRMQGSGRI